MKVEFRRDPRLTEPEVLISAPKLTPEVEELIKKLSGASVGPIPAWAGDRAVLLERDEVARFFTDGKGVSAETAEGIFAVRSRLYELEEELDEHSFVRISNSEIVNIRKITGIDLSLSGTIKMTMSTGSAAYVSRRYMKKIKYAIGL